MMEMLNRLFKYIRRVPGLSNVLPNTKNILSKTMEITFDYGSSIRYTDQEKMDKVKTFILALLRKEPWHLKSKVRIKSIDKGKCIIIVDTNINLDYPESHSHYLKLQEKLTHLFSQDYASSYIPFLEKYGLDVNSKITRFTVKINLHESYQFHASGNQIHRLDFIQKVWGQMIMNLQDNEILSGYLKDIDCDTVEIYQEVNEETGMEESVVFYQMLFDRVINPIPIYDTEIAKALGTATEIYLNHPYLVPDTKEN